MRKIFIFLISILPSNILFSQTIIQPIEIGTQKELFVDDYLIAEMQNVALDVNR